MLHLETIYLNNAATSFPKPEAVLRAAQEALLCPPDEPGRGSASPADGLHRCRTTVAALLGCPAERLHFTSGATESANLLIAGLDLRGVHVIATAAEHNCILRPLYNHRDGPEISIAPCDKAGRVTVESIEPLLRPNTGYLFLNHASNVTGCVQPLAEIAALAHAHGVRLIVDVSQSAGCIPLDADADGLIFTGHKNLLGLTGMGGMYLGPELDVKILKTGGTGTDSLWLELPPGYENREPGTQNLPGLAALAAGADALRRLGEREIAARLRCRRKLLLQSLADLPGVRVYHPEPAAQALPVVSFTWDRLPPGDLGYILAQSFGIVLRTGYHCCPLIHRFLGTPEGTLRASASILTPEEDILALGRALREVCA